jgi:transcriptional regulator with XRE-family HTH domain
VFSKRLVELRKEKKMSQYEIADRLGFSRGQYANYEQGTREPDFSTLQKIADYFNVSTDYLLGRTDDPGTKDGNDKGEMYFLDKENVTPEEAKEALAYIKARRMLKEQDKKKQ